MKKYFILIIMFLLIFTIWCDKNHINLKKYNITTEVSINNQIIKNSNYKCKLDQDCKNFCYNLGNDWVISYSSYCKNKLCTCSASYYDD